MVAENGTIFDLSMLIYLYLSPWRNRMKKPLFSFIHSCTAKRRFQKSPLWIAFLVTVFTRYVRTVGQTGEKHLRFQTEKDTCGRCLC